MADRWVVNASPPWDFVGCCDLYEIKSDFAATVESRLDKVIEVAAPTTAP